MHKIFVFLFLLSFQFSYSQNGFNIIPKPLSVQVVADSFTVNKNTKIVVLNTLNKECKSLPFFSQLIEEYLGVKPGKVVQSYDDVCDNCIQFHKNLSDIYHIDTMGPDAYSLVISHMGIYIAANTDNGIFYALQTLFQLAPIDNYHAKNKTITFPCCFITDAPRYPYRGMHLDVGRHFFPVEFIKKYIDLLAIHKMNYFHWHLTEDQGWRIEIKKYPKLTSVSSKRKESMIGAYDDNKFDGKEYGGFYTQKEIREIVKYAQDRFVTIIPEIEMPGHSKAALAAYPELACSKGPFEVATKWGVFDDVYCPTDYTFNFIEDVLTEVIDLFPGKYIHIGGDECPKDSWKKSDYCQALMKKEGLKDENELQSYFIRRIEKFLNSKGKQLIGWDEILEGGLPPEATVMSWRGTNGGIAAARQNHDVIMTPGSYCYFDHYQSDPSTEPHAIGGYTTLSKVYSYNPTPEDSLTAEQQKHILGAQGNVWTEYMTDSKYVEYMTYPRACALAEVLWSSKDNRNWDDFSNRLQYHFKRLDKMNVNYARSIYDVTVSTDIDTINLLVIAKINKSVTSGTLYMTLLGAEPDRGSHVYTSPVIIPKSCTLKAKLITENGSGKTLSTDFHIHKATALPYVLKNKWERHDGGSIYGLTNGTIGKINQYDTWVSFLGKDLDVTIDLKKEETLNRISFNCYNKNSSWIYLPDYYQVSYSLDGINFIESAKIKVLKEAEDTLGNNIYNESYALKNTVARYIRVFAKNIGKIPEGKDGAGEDAWLFVDEIEVK